MWAWVHLGCCSQGYTLEGIEKRVSSSSWAFSVRNLVTRVWTCIWRYELIWFSLASTGASTWILLMSGVSLDGLVCVSCVLCWWDFHNMELTFVTWKTPPLGWGANSLRSFNAFHVLHGCWIIVSYIIGGALCHVYIPMSMYICCVWERCILYGVFAWQKFLFLAFQICQQRVALRIGQI